MPSPIGVIRVTVDEAGRLKRLTWGPPGEASFQEGRLQGRLQEIGCERAPERLAPVITQLKEYFDGSRRDFDLPIDLGPLTPFQRRVLEATRAIPYGTVQSYKAVASAAGSPLAARAAGQALGNNPIAIIIPCHRVVAHDGSIGGFSAAGGVAAKRWLLEHEVARG